MIDATKFFQKVVWITGASSGIGEALALQFSKLGATLILSSNEPEELDRVKTECLRHNENIEVVEIDLADTNGLEAAAGMVLKKYGRVDYLFNNGGISQRALTKDMALSMDLKVMQINFLGQITLAKSLLPSMLEHKGGHIIVTTSVLGKLGAPMRSAYAASKHALHGFFDSLRSEVWRKNIYITLVCPAAVATNISKAAVTGNGAQFGRTEKLISEGITPEEAAAQIIRAAAKRKEEVIIGKGIGKTMAQIKQHFPALFSFMIKRLKIT